MKNIAILFIFFSSLLYSSNVYKSLHQLPDAYNNKVGFYDQLLASSGSMKLSYTENLYAGDAVTCQEKSDDICINTLNPHAFQWCSKTWYKYRVYLPKNAKISMKIGATRNATYVMLYYFIPDNSSLRDVDLSLFKVAYRQNAYTDFTSEKAMESYLFAGYNVLYKPIIIADFINIEKVPVGGWLYINLNQAGSIEYSYQGHVPSAKPYISLRYYNLPTSSSEKQQLLSSLRFDTHGDPVENFSVLREKQKSCSGTQVLNIQGTGNSSVVGLSVKENRSNDIVDYILDFFSGKYIIEGIEKSGINGEINHNITISAHIDPCLQIIDAQSSVTGDTFYSENAQEWGDKTAKSHYVKFEFSSPDSSSVVLNENENIKITIKTKKMSSCTQATSTFEVRYKVNDIIQEKSTTATTVFSSSSSSSSPFSGSQNYGGDSSGQADSEEEARLCLLQGGKLIIENGEYKGCSTSSFSSSSSSSSSPFSGSQNYGGDSSGQADSEEEARLCLLQGGKLIIENGEYKGCSTSSFSSSSSSSSSKYSGVEIQRNYQESIASKVANKSFPIKGYYIHYEEDDPFGWLYISKSKNLVAKIEKPKTDESYEWTFLHATFRNILGFDRIDVQDGNITFGKSLLEEVVGDDLLIYQESIASKVANKSFPIKGYYIHYEEDDPFGWLYISKSKNLVAKIEKPKTDESYEWTFLHATFRNILGFDRIDVQDGNITFGKSLWKETSDAVSSSQESSFSSQQSIDTTNDEELARECILLGGTPKIINGKYRECEFSSSSVTSSQYSSTSSILNEGAFGGIE